MTKVGKNGKVYEVKRVELGGAEVAVISYDTYYKQYLVERLVFGSATPVAYRSTEQEAISYVNEQMRK